METLPIVVDRERARELYRAYRSHQHYQQPIDEEIRRTYRHIAQGRVVIKALASIANAGVGEDGLPKLAIARADQDLQCVYIRSDGSAFMSTTPWPRHSHGTSTVNFEWPKGTFPPLGPKQPWRSSAIVPIIPLPQRPKRGLQNYHILWEAEWSGAVPFDPMLLRRLGRGDLWLVVAAWDLTEVERAALATRVRA